MANQLILAPSQQQKLSPNVIQSLHLLSLPVTTLNEYLEEVMSENPLFDMDEFYSEEETYHLDKDYSYNNRNKSNSLERLSNGERYCIKTPEVETLHGFLNLQLSMCNLPGSKEKIGREIIGNINDDGYFVGNLKEITYYHVQDPIIGHKVLEIIQSFFPLGVGARNLAECLTLQIDPMINNYDEVVGIINNDLDDLAHRKIGKLSKKYNMKKEKVQEILDSIQTLNPRPGNSFRQNENPTYFIPDIIITKEESNYNVHVTVGSNRSLQINERYLHLLRDKGITNEEKQYILTKHNEANVLKNNFQKRQVTLKKLGIFLLNAQKSFFENGPSAMKPLRMKSAAEVIGVHVSTISRAVQEKYIQTPIGTYPLNYFFSVSAIEKSEGTGVISSTQIKGKIKEIVMKENPFKPFSDQEIMCALKREGIVIARRTVSKYRQELGLEGQLKRKRFA